MFQVPKSAYALAVSSIREFMTPGNELMEVPSPSPAAQEQKTFTEDYCRDGMVVFEVSFLVGFSSCHSLTWHLD